MKQNKNGWQVKSLGEVIDSLESGGRPKGGGLLSGDIPSLDTEGIALTTLRPAGTAEINGKRVDVVTDSEYIEHGKPIVVTAVEGMRVVVREKKNS